MLKRTFEALQKERHQREESGKQDRIPVSFLCENIRSLYNVGSVFRTCDGIRAEKIYLCGITGYPPRKEIDKVALGAAESVPWEYFKNTFEAVRIIKERGIPLIALEQTDMSRPFQEFEYPFPSVIVLGHEYEGTSQELLDMCDYSVEIPMLGIKHSLNVATACGVIAYEILRQYNGR